MKKMIAICLILALLAPSALAAPLRESGEHALSDAERIHIRPLLDALVYAAVLKDVLTLESGEAPPQSLIEGVLLRALSRGALLYDGSDPARATLSKAQLEALYAQVFTYGRYPDITAPQCPCITVSGDGLAFDIANPDTEYVGAYVYESIETHDGVTLQCDLYLQNYYDTMPQDTPEEALLWLRGAELTLARNANAPYGFTVSRFEIGPEYEAAQLLPYENQALGIELIIPDIFLQNFSETASGFSAHTTDGMAFLTFESQNSPGDMDVAQTAEALRAAGYTVQEYTEWSFLTWQGDGVCGMRYVLEDMSAGFTMRYPPERGREFTLYAEFMTNSFNLTELSVG